MTQLEFLQSQLKIKEQELLTVISESDVYFDSFIRDIFGIGGTELLRHEKLSELVTIGLGQSLDEKYLYSPFHHRCYLHFKKVFNEIQNKYIGFEDDELSSYVTTTIMLIGESKFWKNVYKNSKKYHNILTEVERIKSNIKELEKEKMIKREVLKKYL